MKFTCKEANIKEINITAEEIINKAVSDDYGIFSRGMHEPGAKVMLNSSDSNIIGSTFERGSVEMYIVPFEGISLMHYSETSDDAPLIAEPIHFTELSDDDAEMLFDFADFILTCYFNQTVNQ